MMTAMTNVVPSHLLDRKLFDFDAFQVRGGGTDRATSCSTATIRSSVSRERSSSIERGVGSTARRAAKPNTSQPTASQSG